MKRSKYLPGKLLLVIGSMLSTTWKFKSPTSSHFFKLETKDQHFQFEGDLYQQIDGVAMGSSLGPIMANAFLCSLEDDLEKEDKLPNLYRRYVDDTITAMPDVH